MNTLSHKAFYLIVLNFIKYGVGFLVPIFVARLLTKEEYGTYQQILLIVNTLSGIMVLGIPLSVYYFYNRTDEIETKKILITQTFIVLNLSALLVAIALYMGSSVVSGWLGNPALETLVPIASIYVYCYIAVEFYFHMLVSKDLYSRSLIFGISESLIRSFLVLSAAFLYHDVRSLVIAIAIYAGIKFIYCTYDTYADFVSIRVLKLRQTIKDQILYSLPIAFTSLVGLIGGLIDRYMISLNYATAQFATYSVGAIELPLDVIFQASVANVLRTKLPALAAEGKVSEIKVLIKESTRKLALIIMPIFMFLVFYSDDFIIMLFSEKYIDSVNVFRIYLMLTPLHIFILSVVPQSFGLTGIGFRIASFSIITNIILNFILLKWIGFIGPAIATVISTYLGIGIYIFIVRRLLKAKLTEFVPLYEIAKIILLCASLLICLEFVSLTPSMIFNFFINGAIYVFILAFVFWNLNIFRDQDKSILINLRKKFLKY